MLGIADGIPQADIIGGMPGTMSKPPPQPFERMLETPSRPLRWTGVGGIHFTGKQSGCSEARIRLSVTPEAYKHGPGGGQRASQPRKKTSSIRAYQDAR